MSSAKGAIVEVNNLPTNYKPPKRPNFISDILNNNDLKTVLIKHDPQKDLKRNDTEKFRNTFKKQVCISMLTKGFHESFAEILDLIQIEVEYRQDLGHEHPVWEKPVLIQETNKFEFLCSKLNIAEEAKRRNDLKSIYASLHDLATYFEWSEDVWLSDYFFKKCLSIVSIGQSNWEIRKKAESHCNLGLSYEQQTTDYTAKPDQIRALYFRGMTHFEHYYNLCKGQDWIDDKTNKRYAKETEKKNDLDNYNHEDKLFTQSCIHLQRVYKIISERYCKDSSEKVEYLIKALDVCKESGVKVLEGQISFKLGSAYEESNDLETALSCFNNFYELSRKINDSSAFGEASEALANCYKKIGNLNKSIEYLKKYLDQASSLSMNSQYGKICGTLASIYNSLGQYDMATLYSKKAFEISNQTDKRTSEFNRVIYATAKAHKELRNFNLNVAANNKESVQELIKSKTDLICYIIPQDK